MCVTKIQSLSLSDVFFRVPDAPKRVSAAPDPGGGELTMIPQIPIRLGRGHQELKYPCPSPSTPSVSRSRLGAYGAAYGASVFRTHQ